MTPHHPSLPWAPPSPAARRVPAEIKTGIRQLSAEGVSDPAAIQGVLNTRAQAHAKANGEQIVVFSGAVEDRGQVPPRGKIRSLLTDARRGERVHNGYQSVPPWTALDQSLRGLHPTGMHCPFASPHCGLFRMAARVSALSEKDATTPKKMDQLQPSIAVFSQEFTGQLAYFGPTVHLSQYTDDVALI